LMAYLQSDWDNAQQLCEHIDDSVLGMKELKQSIASQLEEARGFDDLLDQMKNF
jgi:phage shock protein A